MCYLHKLVQAAPEVQQYIDVEATRSCNISRPYALAKIEVKVKGGRDGCRFAKEAFQRLFASSEEHFINGLRPRCTMESSPEMKPVIVQGAKMLGILERDNGTKHLKPEWGLKLAIYQEKPGSPSMLLAEYSTPSGWTFNAENLQIAKQGLTADILRTAMRA